MLTNPISFSNYVDKFSRLVSGRFEFAKFNVWQSLRSDPDHKKNCGKYRNLTRKNLVSSMDDDYTIYREENLFAESLSVLREIRRQGRLCDIILKVSLMIFLKAKVFITKKNYLGWFRNLLSASRYSCITNSVLQCHVLTRLRRVFEERDRVEGNRFNSFGTFNKFRLLWFDQNWYSKLSVDNDWSIVPAAKQSARCLCSIFNSKVRWIDQRIQRKINFFLF